MRAATAMALGLSAVVDAATLPRSAVESRAVWQPAVNATWQIEIQSQLSIDTKKPAVTPSNVSIFDIDLFDNSDDGTSSATIKALQSLGIKVICYFSAGSYEPGRPDSNKFVAADKGNELDGWPGEYWLKLSSTNVRTIMANRIATAASVGCDAIDPDNVDAFDNDNGLGLTEDDSIDYIKFLTTEAAKYNMAVGLKNAASIVTSVLPYVQFSVNEECVANKECKSFKPFIDAGKPVFHIEYPSGAGSKSGIPAATAKKDCQGSDITIPSFSTVLKTEDLDGWVQYCDGTIATTATE